MKRMERYYIASIAGRESETLCVSGGRTITICAHKHQQNMAEVDKYWPLLRSHTDKRLHDSRLCVFTTLSRPFALLLWTRYPANIRRTCVVSNTLTQSIHMGCVWRRNRRSNAKEKCMLSLWAVETRWRRRSRCRVPFCPYILYPCEQNAQLEMPKGRWRRMSRIADEKRNASQMHASI